MTGAEARALRLNLGYTQEQLAQVLGCSKPTVSRREDKGTGPVPPEHAEALRALAATPKAEGPQAAQKQPPPTAVRTVQARRPARTHRESSAPHSEPAERVWEAEEIGAVDVGAVWLASLLLLAIHQHLTAHRVSEEVEAAFARLHVGSGAQRAQPRPPPLPRHRDHRLCWRCGT